MRRELAVAVATLLAGCQSGAPEIEQQRVPIGSEVVVLGDSTGNDDGEWVAEWGRTLTDKRHVKIRGWDFEKEEFADDWTPLGGRGSRLRIWNLSHPGAEATYPTTDGHWDGIQTEPDTVILSFGYNGFVEDAVPKLADLADAVEQRWPDAELVVTLQGPATEAAGRLQAMQDAKVPAIREWAAGRGYPTIDVWSAFTEAPGPLSRLVKKDGLHPNQRGAAAWVEAVEETMPRVSTPGQAAW